jgi:Cd2+/Zn2+-exporting ATPase/Cu+-exporting ATPase
MKKDMFDEFIVELAIGGMDCAECTKHVQQAIEKVPHVKSAQVYLASEKAIVHFDKHQENLSSIEQAVKDAGYKIVNRGSEAAAKTEPVDFTKDIFRLLGFVFGAVLFVVVIGEWLGLFEAITERVPWPIGWGLVLIAGFPVFTKVLQAALRKQIIAHTLMTFGVLAALAVGEWATAAVVVFFMRVGDYVEHFTTEHARGAVKELTTITPQSARVVRNGSEVEVPIDEVQVGEAVVVRPGERIPIDGRVIGGQATINQAAITGESMPLDAGPGSTVYAASIAQLGSIRIQVTRVGEDTTFGRVIKLVEEAEAHRADVQRLADKFSTWYLPVVAGTAALTYLIGRNPLATAAVLVVACSCAFALATPIAILASVGASAKRGLLIKGGRYLENLARADSLLIDKTGTLTFGKPQISDIFPLDGSSEAELITAAASAERYSEHPLAEAVRQAALERELPLYEPVDFESLPGMGVKAKIEGHQVVVGGKRLVNIKDTGTLVIELESQGKTPIFVEQDKELIGILAAEDTLRPEIPETLAKLHSLGLKHIELLTGDNPLVAASLAKELGIAYQADLLPEDKIAVVKKYQREGHTVIMVGDGVNDAPALAQADIGIAMGAAGSDVALEAAHLALLRDDWKLIPEALIIAQRTMGVIRLNIAFTVIYNIVGLALAAFGYIPPILAAAAQSLPDLGILANSARLLRQE